MFFLDIIKISYILYYYINLILVYCIYILIFLVMDVRYKTVSFIVYKISKALQKL